MDLKDLLSKKKAAIVEGWFEAILRTYPPDTASFMRTKANQFDNPVGHTIRQGIEGIFHSLLEGGGADSEKVSRFLDDIIRVRAVQDFAASEAIAFIFMLKDIIRQETAKGVGENQLFPELQELESRIDSMGLLSFDIYMKCREKIYDIKADETKRMTFRLLQRANLIVGDEPAQEAGNNI